MKLREVCEKLDLKVLAGEQCLDRDITGVYVCDLLSWVMSHAVKGNAWITVQTHSNVIAISTLLELGCVIVPEDIEVEAETILKANEEELPILSSSLNAHQLSIELYNMGVGK